MRNLAWPLKSKKRHRSGSGGSKEFEQKNKKSLSVEQQRKLSGEPLPALGQRRANYRLPIKSLDVVVMYELYLVL